MEVSSVIVLAKWPTKVPESLIPPYSCRQPSPYQDETIFRTESITRSMSLLAIVLAVFSIFLMVFVGLPQRLGDMVKAVIQVILEFAIAEDQQALPWRIHDKRDLSPGECEKLYRILDLPLETSSSRLCKNVKTLYSQLDIDPSMVVHPKCPTKEPQNVFVDVVGEDGWDKVPDSCPECGTALREGGKLNGLSRINKFCALGKGNVIYQMERPAYLQDANPGKILRHQLDGSCYQVDDQDVRRERGCLVLTINASIDWADPND
ncbi:hypothetical protein AYX15_07013 [Cryptococcus neoformans]|nr:hypothetical protein AYX15_07013 [Cryptococcus neoformans var. grubii]